MRLFQGSGSQDRSAVSFPMPDSLKNFASEIPFHPARRLDL